VLDRWSSIISSKKHEWIYEATLGRLQLDNHGQLDPLFPVILRPKCTTQNEEHDHFTMENVQPVMQIYISIKTNIPNVQYINWYEFLVKELECRIELEHLMSILDWALAFQTKQGAGLTSSHQIFVDTSLTNPRFEERKSMALLNESQSVTNPAKAKKAVHFTESVLEEKKVRTEAEVEADDGDEVIDDKKNQLQSWRSNLITDAANTVYIEHFKGSPLCIEISIFKQTRVNNGGKKDKNAIFDLLSSLGLSFTNITGAPMTLNALEIENVYGSQAVVKELLINHYSSNIKSNVLKLIGSTDLFGNPTDFVNTLGTGARQFYYAPKEGFMKGPLQGGLGLLKGTGSLMAHAAGGFSGSVSKITNSLNRGFLVLSADSEYRQKKEISDIKDKPSGVLDGVGKGILGFGKSVWSGASGIVMQPLKGA